MVEPFLQTWAKCYSIIYDSIYSFSHLLISKITLQSFCCNEIALVLRWTLKPSRATCLTKNRKLLTFQSTMFLEFNLFQMFMGNSLQISETKLFSKIEILFRKLHNTQLIVKFCLVNMNKSAIEFLQLSIYHSLSQNSFVTFKILLKYIIFIKIVTLDVHSIVAFLIQS